MDKKKQQLSDKKKSAVLRIQRTEAYAERVRLLFAKTVNDILALNKSMPKLEEGVMYSFDGTDAKMQKEVEMLLRRLASTVTTAIRNGINLEWEEANVECDKFIASLFGKKVLSSPEFSAWVDRNTSARDAFANRADKGLGLSDRVWKSVKQLREEMEVAMTVTIGEGDSASSMSRKVREYLNDPELMFRRFRYKADEKEVMDKETGKITKVPVYGRKWKKRVKDEATGKYKWVDYDRDSYKTGAGVYKSSAKNAMRVARTETNMAYRQADHQRWQNMEFVLGQHIELSRNHPKRDICDDLEGDYPKDFIFDGWHPQCFCVCTPILVDWEEQRKVFRAKLKGETYTPKGRRITECPDNFKSWVNDNKEKIHVVRKSGKDPYFIKNNAAKIDGIINPQLKALTPIEIAEKRHAARTPEQVEAIKRAANNRASTRKFANKILDYATNGHPDIDTTKLQQALHSGNDELALQEARAIKQTIAKRNKLAKKAVDNMLNTSTNSRFEAKTTQDAIDFIKQNIAENVNINIKKQQLPLINDILNQMRDRMAKYGLSKFDILGEPRNKKADASYDEITRAFNINLSRLSSRASFKTNEKWAKKGIKYSHYVSVEDFVRATIDHEFGHVLMTKYGMRSEAIEAFGKAAARRNGIIETDVLGYYSTTSVDEYFAEAFAMWNGSDKKLIIGETKRLMESLDRKIANKLTPPSKLGTVITKLGDTKIAYNEVRDLDKKLTNDEIIKRVGGGDLTKGSCSSLALTYAGNMAGLDVLDFRDGESRKHFASTLNIKEIASNVGGVVNKDYNDFNNAKTLLSNTVVGKEYYFTCGAHAAIIRKTDKGFEYLELQSPSENGFKPLNDIILRWRFGAKRSHSLYGQKYETIGVLIDTELLKNDSKFRKMLGYINTSSDKQRKSASGTIK